MYKQKEHCIRCNNPTPYDLNTPITLRRYYIEGSGQLCRRCYQELYGMAPSLGCVGGSDYYVSKKVIQGLWENR